MPGPIVHLIVQQRLVGELRRTDGGAPFAGLLNEDRCSPFTGFGSMGPDFLFFSVNEYGEGLQDLVHFVFGIYDALEPLIDFYEENIEPVVDEIEDAVEAFDAAALQGLLGAIKNTAELAVGALTTKIASFVTSEVDLFFPFFPRVQTSEPESEWFWFDLLHYRRTGRFCNELFALAGDDRDLQRYAAGYASHIGTDVVGHAFVNAVVGGPYRMHWHRHKAVENWIDAWARRRYRDPRWVRRCLNIDPEEDKYSSRAVSGSYWYRLVEFEDGKLPDKLATMFAQALRNVYTPGGPGSGHPNFLSAADLDDTYRLWLEWFRRSTSVGTMVPPVPPPAPGAAAAALVNDLVANFPDPPWAGDDPPSGDFDLFAVFAALVALVEYLVEVLGYLLEWTIEHIDDILLLGPVEALRLLVWLLYQVQLAIYQIYDNDRFILVLGGYLFPEPQDLLKNPWGRAYVNTAFVHTTGGPAPSARRYPLKRPGWNGEEPAYALVGATAVHLTYPVTVMETRRTESMPRPMFGADPNTFIDGTHPYDPAIEVLYDCDRPEGDGDEATQEVDRNTRHTSQFGNAIGLSSRLIARFLEGGMPNFNLDADRGYAWKTWDVTKLPGDDTLDTLDPEDGEEVHAEYVDP